MPFDDDDLDCVVYPAIVGECVNNPQPIAFIAKDPTTPWIGANCIRVGGLPIRVPSETNRGFMNSVPEELGMHKYHHYASGPVATQYCSFSYKRDKAEWLALHEEWHHESLRGLCAASEFFRRSIIETFYESGPETVFLCFMYPTVIVQGTLLEVRAGRRGHLSTREVDHIRYCRSELSGRDETRFMIDVVTERAVPSHLKVISTEMNEARRRARADLKRLQTATKALMERRSKFPSREEWVKAIDVPSGYEREQESSKQA